jgi:hypothetical protein
MIISITQHSDSFAENKDIARDIRENLILPAYVDSSDDIILDFDGIDSSTQSFIHALISEVFQKHSDEALSRLAFRNCNQAVKSLITTVINYSLD